PTLSYIQNVVRQHWITQVGTYDLDGAICAAPMHTQAPLGAAERRTTAGCKCLPDGHTAFDAISTSTLDFTVNVIHGLPINIENVAAGYYDIVSEIVRQIHVC